MALSVDVDGSRTEDWAVVVAANGRSGGLASTAGGRVSRPIAPNPFSLLFRIASDRDGTKLDRASTVVVSLFCLSAKIKSNGA